MSRVARYVVLGGVMDFVVYVALSLVPLLSERWGAGALMLGGLPVAWGLVYCSTATLGGKLSDRVSRTMLMRVGLAVCAGACVFFAQATRVWHFYAGLPLVAVGMACFWPALQAGIADESGPGTLTRNLGWFNVTWSLGKGLGVLCGGILLDRLDRRGFYVAAGVAALLFLVAPRVPRGGGRGERLAAGAGAIPVETRRSFWWAALLANFAGFGLGTTIIAHYPEMNSALGRGGTSYGLVVGGVFLAQTVASGVLLRFPGWHYRALPLILCQVLAVVSGVMLATGLPVLLLVALSLGLGAGFAVAYFSSIYYSLHVDVGRGGRAGFHETILASGNFMVPMLAGVAAHLADSPRVPYLFAAGVMVVSLAVQIRILRRARGGSPARGSPSDGR